MFELDIEVTRTNTSEEQFNELVELQLALIGGGTGTPALE